MRAEKSNEEVPSEARQRIKKLTAIGFELTVSSRLTIRSSNVEQGDASHNHHHHKQR
jgi:hypothetical protein